MRDSLRPSRASTTNRGLFDEMNATTPPCRESRTELRKIEQT